MDKKFSELKKSLNAFIAEIDERIGGASEDAKRNWKKFKIELQQRENDADDAFSQLAASGKNASDEVKEGARTALNNLREVYDRAKGAIKDTIRKR
ncbi:MAG: hypothetical protein WC459_02885 [Patescibacteria group bacterium]